MKARDVDTHDARMMRRVADGMYEIDSARRGRLHTIADFIERHHTELAECEHGALRGRCTEPDCEPENFEADHVVNRAQDVAALSGDMGLVPAIDAHSFSDADFRDLLALAWIGARVSAIRGEEPTT